MDEKNNFPQEPLDAERTGKENIILTPEEEEEVRKMMATGNEQLSKAEIEALVVAKRNQTESNH